MATVSPLILTKHASHHLAMVVAGTLTTTARASARRLAAALAQIGTDVDWSVRIWGTADNAVGWPRGSYSELTGRDPNTNTLNPLRALFHGSDAPLDVLYLPSLTSVSLVGVVEPIPASVVVAVPELEIPVDAVHAERFRLQAQKLLSLATAVIVPSVSLRDQVLAEFKVTEERIQVIAPPTTFRNDIVVALEYVACFERAMNQRFATRPRIRNKPMVSREERVLYVINHATLKPAELPVIRSLGLEAYASKIISGHSGFRSGATDYSDNDFSTLPRWVIDELDRHNFYDDAITPAFAKLLNDHFGTAILSGLPNVLAQMLTHFRGRIVVRAFGREAPTNYAKLFGYEELALWEMMWRSQDRFWLGVGYDSITEYEPTILRRSAVTLPLTMPDVMYAEGGTWIGTDQRVFFICPDILGWGDYYGKIYRDFKENFGHLPHLIGGRQIIPVNDPNVIGYVSDERMKQYFREMRVMYYHSREPRHLHYHPLEAIVYGMPLIYMNGGLLEHFAGRPDLPGACDTYAEANAKLQRILAGDEEFIRAVIESQAVILEEFAPDFVRRMWQERFVGLILSRPLTPDVVPFGRWEIPTHSSPAETRPELPLQVSRRILFYGRMATGDAAYRTTITWIEQVLQQTEVAKWQVDVQWGASTMDGAAPLWEAPQSNRVQIKPIMDDVVHGSTSARQQEIVTLPISIDPDNPPAMPPFNPLPERASPPAAPYLTLDDLYQMVESYEVVCFPQPLGLLSPNLDVEGLTPLPIIVYLSDLAHEYGDNAAEEMEPNAISREVAIWARLAQVMVFPSEAVRDDAIKRYAISAERTRVVALPYLAPALSVVSNMVTSIQTLPERFLLATIEDPALDNLDTILEALSYVRRRGETVPPLVVVGSGARDALLTDHLDTPYQRWLQQIIHDGQFAVGKDIVLVEPSEVSNLTVLCGRAQICLSVSRVGVDRYGLIAAALWAKSPLIIGKTRLTQQFETMAILEPADDPIALGDAILAIINDYDAAVARAEMGGTWIKRQAQQHSPRLVQEAERMAADRTQPFIRPRLPLSRKASMELPPTQPTITPSKSTTLTVPSKGANSPRSWLVRFNTFVVHSVLPIFRLTSLNRYRRLEQELKRMRVDYDATTAELLTLRAKPAVTTVTSPTGDIQADLKRLIQRIEGLEAQITENVTALPLFIHAKVDPDEKVASSLTAVRTEGGSTLRNDRFYTALEMAFRGSDAVITQRQEHYLPWLQTPLPTEQHPILDIGCGRGEFLRLLRQANIACMGVDPNGKHIEDLQQQGFIAHQQGGVEYLETRVEASLSAIVAFQVIEHVELAYLERMLQLAMTTLVDDGQILLETVNPYCLATFRTFYVDPTHVRPLPVDLLTMMMWAAGFTELQVFYQNPVLTHGDIKDGLGVNAYETYALLGKRPARSSV